MLFKFYAAVFALSHLVCVALAAPIILHARQGGQTAVGTSNTTVETELVPIVNGTEIDPTLIDLMDQISNYQKQVDEGQPGSPGFDDLVQKLNSTKAQLNQQISGVAVLVTTTIENIPTTTPTQAEVSVVTITSSSDVPASTTSPESSASVTSTTETESAAPSTVTQPPTITSVDTNVPVVTIVTQVGTSVVVVASQGVTSTVTLATITGLQTASPTASSSTVASSVTTFPAPVSSGINSASSVAPTVVVSTAPANTVTFSEVQGASTTGTVTRPGVAANAAAGSDSGAFSLAPVGIKSQMFMGMTSALIFGTISLL